MAATKKKLTGKRWALIAVAVVVAYVVYKRRKAAQTNVADPAVPFTPSPYFYTSPFADSGGGGGSGGSSGGSGSSATTSGPRKDPHPQGGTVIPSPGSNSGGNSHGTVFSGGSGVPIEHNRV